jgi:hypothetical protein
MGVVRTEFACAFHPRPPRGGSSRSEPATPRGCKLSSGPRSADCGDLPVLSESMCGFPAARNRSQLCGIVSPDPRLFHRLALTNTLQKSREPPPAQGRAGVGAHTQRVCGVSGAGRRVISRETNGKVPTQRSVLHVGPASQAVFRGISKLTSRPGPGLRSCNLSEA